MTGDPRSMVGEIPDDRTGPQKCRDALNAALERASHRPERELPTMGAGDRPTTCEHPLTRRVDPDHTVCISCGTVFDAPRTADCCPACASRHREQRGFVWESDGEGASAHEVECGHRWHQPEQEEQP